jgi:hypothetical protein
MNQPGYIQEGQGVIIGYLLLGIYHRRIPGDTVHMPPSYSQFYVTRTCHLPSSPSQLKSFFRNPFPRKPIGFALFIFFLFQVTELLKFSFNPLTCVKDHAERTKGKGWKIEFQKHNRTTKRLSECKLRGGLFHGSVINLATQPL